MKHKAKIEKVLKLHLSKIEKLKNEKVSKDSKRN